MTKLFMTTALAASIFAGTAFAQDATVPTPVLSGEVSLDFAETANDNYGGTMGLELGVDVTDLATIDLNFKATDGNALTLDTWAVGTTLGGVGVAMGDDLGLFPEAEGEQTLTAPAMTEALRLTVGDAQVAVGFTDWTSDIADISNVQGAYTIDQGAFAITAAGDYNLDTKNTVLGGSVGTTMNDMALTGFVTYDVDAEVFGFENVVTRGGLTAYLNGDDTDALQNIGGEYEFNVNGATFTAGANYNVDTEDFAPTAGVAFNF